MKIINVSTARQLIRRSLSDTGLKEEYVRYFEEALIETSLKGIDTHGIRLLPLYVKELAEGRANTNPAFAFSNRGFDHILRMDADAAPGIVAGYYATEKCIELAKKYGIGVVSVYNSNHFGAASVYGDYIAAHNLIGFVTTNAAPRVVPFNGTEKLFGTDPICFTAPVQSDGPLFSLDMATSQISYSKVKEYRQHNLPLEPGWGVNAEGNFEVHPDNVYGLSPVGGYKGQGLSMMVQILTSLLAGGPFDYDITHLDEEPFDKGREICHFIMAFNIDAFMPADQFRKRMKDWTTCVGNSAPKKNQKVMQPGEPEYFERKRRMENGIPLNEADYKKLLVLSSKYDLIIN